jgi:transposase-like protein
MQKRKFSREVKIEAVRLVRERGVSVAQASRDIAVHEETVQNLGGLMRHGETDDGPIAQRSCGPC